MRRDSREYMRRRIRSGEKYKGLRNNHNTVWEGYTPKQGYVPDGVCHKNVAQGYGARVRMSQGLYGLRDVCRKGHVITEDRIMIVGAGIDAVTCHMIVTVITYSI